ncbi:MAG: tellurium resistance TerZ family protein [Cytophagales bacterium]|nr:tellurium resistance TerZ family protein [Cytophagales bacterium]MDW8384650.1 TerD family protein [Flammeovirgaceae bacterium]
MEVKKRTGIELGKGDSINLMKNGKNYDEICVGLNWGVIKKKTFLGLLEETIAVDLDGSLTLFDKHKNPIETVYYNHLISNDHAIFHSGDDRAGDVEGDDGQDNELIEIHLHRINPAVHQIVFYLNSYKGQDFSEIPYSKIRVFEGIRQDLRDVLCTFNLSAEPSFRGYVSMVLGKLFRTNENQWNFKAIGAPLPSKRINDTIPLIQQNFLD